MSTQPDELDQPASDAPVPDEGRPQHLHGNYVKGARSEGGGEDELADPDASAPDQRRAGQDPGPIPRAERERIAEEVRRTENPSG